LESRLLRVLVTYREDYKFNYAAFPSNSHMAESAVKDANFCQIPGRGELLSSNFFTVRAGLVETINMNLIESFRQKGDLKGNRYVRGGKYGERKKTDGTNLEEKEWQMRVSGETKTCEALKHILDRHDKLKDLPPAEKQKWDRLHAGITDPEV
jgi:phage-related protein